MSISDIRSAIASALYANGDTEYDGFKTYGAKKFNTPIVVKVETDDGSSYEKTANGVYIDKDSGNIVLDDVSVYDGCRITHESWAKVLDAINEE